MTFTWPGMLLLLGWLPLGIAAYLWLQRRRRQLGDRSGFLAGSANAGGRLGARRHVPVALYAAGLVLLTVALARPRTVVSQPRLEGTVMLTFDVSGSMAADDVEPTRMEAAKAAARDFVARQPPSVAIGIVAFSDGGLTVQRPTNDQAALVSTINRLRPARGTSLGQGIQVSLSALEAGGQPATHFYSNPAMTPTPTPTPPPVPAGSNASQLIVLLTDGENTANPDPMEAAQLAADRGVRIFTVGLGSPQGTTLQINGFTVHTELDEGALQAIARLTSGDYFNAQSQEDLYDIYDEVATRLVVKTEQMEVTALVAGAGLLLLLAGGLVALLWLGRMP
jgi:Ca-activated chloride channel family protein